MLAIMLIAASTHNAGSTVEASLSPRPITQILVVVAAAWLASRVGRGLKR